MENPNVPAISVAAKLELASKETCSGSSVDGGGHLLLVVSLVLLGALFNQRIVVGWADGVPPIFDARGFV